MRLLVIGGTQFFGRALVEAALNRGDAVTVLSRGEKRPPFWERITHLAGAHILDVIGCDQVIRAPFGASFSTVSSAT